MAYRRNKYQEVVQLYLTAITYQVMDQLLWVKNQVNQYNNLQSPIATRKNKRLVIVKRQNV